MRHHRGISTALTGITAAVIGVIANLGLYFAVHTLFSGTRVLEAGPLHLSFPTSPPSVQLLPRSPWWH